MSSRSPKYDPKVDIRNEPKADTVNPEDAPRLPSYEEALDAWESGRLPGYKTLSSARYHPYRRPTIQTVDEVDRYFNTIFDEEFVLLDVPRIRRSTQTSPLELEQEIHLRLELERAIQSELRVNRLSTVIQDFVEGVTRAHTRE